MCLVHLPINSAGLPLQNLGRFADIELEEASLRLATAFENLALLTIKEVLILLWAVV